MPLFPSRRKLFSSKPCVAAKFSHKVPLFPSRRKLFAPKPCVAAPEVASHYSLAQSPVFAPDPSRRAQLSPRTKQPARTLWVSFAPAALNRRPRFRPAMVRPKTRKWSALIFADHVLARSPISYPSSLPLQKPSRQYAHPPTPPLQIPYTNFLSLALAPIISLQISSTNVMSVSFPLQLCPDIFLLCSIRRILSTLPLQIPSTYVTSDAFSRQFCYRNHLPVLSQHRYISVFGERRASLHLYID